MSFYILLGNTTIQAQEAILGTEAQRKAGKKIYDQKCSQCHGYNGDANSVGKEFFRPRPRDFTSGIFKFRSTANGELPTHEDLKRSIKNGMPYTGMPAWPDFSDQELTNLAYYLKTFSEDFVDYGDVKPLPLPKAPSYSEELAKRGRVVYEENQCLDCHGNAGRGDGKSAPTLKDHWNQPIRPADLTKRWTFRGGPGREDIYRTFTTGLDGSPMPSYNIQPSEDQWALVDYVYSMGESDEANYATMVVATGLNGSIDFSQGKALFENAAGALFPVVGQVIEPGRTFYPGVNAVEVKAVYSADEIAIMLTWHDMTAETTGKNSPMLETPRFEPEAAVTDSTQSPESFSDAAAILLPSKMPEGTEKPYFMFGDSKNPMDIWLADLAKDSADFFIGKGSKNIEAAGSGGLSVVSGYEEGEWHVIFKRTRLAEEGLAFEEGSFVPVAFSVWDGFNEERGNKRGLTTWYYLYLEPLQKVSPAGPMAKSGGITFLILLGIVAFARIKYRNKI
jgi:mono/diheme cytochrome c family protein